LNLPNKFPVIQKPTTTNKKPKSQKNEKKTPKSQKNEKNPKKQKK